MTKTFVDSVYFLALASVRDQHYRRSIDFPTAGRRLLTTEYVFVEVANSLAKANMRQRYLDLLDLWNDGPGGTIVPASHRLFMEGTNRYRQRADKDWSLTDCISFVVMDQRGIREALTADHHFEQAGFVALLK